MVVIALDIGGTKIVGALVSTKGEIVHSKKIFLSSTNKKIILQNILYVIKFLRLVSHEKIKGIGISIAGIVKDGKIIIPGSNMSSLENLDLKKFIEHQTGLKTVVENDANCFALAESIYGKHKSKKSLVGFIWGTGIGSGLVVNKQIIQGSQGAFGEVGHIKIPIYIDSDKKQYYSVEHLCGGKYIHNAYTNTLSSKSLPASKILLLNDPKAKKISNIAITTLAWTLSLIVNTIDPDVIVIGGGMSNVSPVIYSRIKREMKKYCMPKLYSKLKLEKYSTSDDAGVLGAAHLAILNS